MLHDILIEPATYAFMQRALLAVVVIGAVSGVIGAYVVTRGMAFLGDALAHSVLPGVAVAFLTSGGGQGSLLFGGLAAGVLSALGIGIISRRRELTEDVAIGIVFAGMLALGIGIISRAENYATDLNHILIGNILTVRESDLLLMTIIGGVVLAVIAALYKEFLIVSFDPTLAQTLRLPVETLRLVLLVLIAMTTVIGLQAVGIALVAALLVTPAATARFFTKRLHHMMLMAAFIGAGSGVVGIYLAWHLEVEASATIVLTMTVWFLLSLLLVPRKGSLRAAIRRIT